MKVTLKSVSETKIEYFVLKTTPWMISDWFGKHLKHLNFETWALYNYTIEQKMKIAI